MTGRADDHDTTTLSHVAPSKGPRRATEPFLFVVLHADELDVPSSRHALGDIDEVHLRRGSTFASVRVDDENRRQLVLTIPDRWMSSTHAILRREKSKWRVEDKRSKNGTLIDGKRVESAALAPTTVIEVGHTFLLFREEMSTSDGAQDFRLSSEVPTPLSTLSPALRRSFDLLTEVAASSLPVLVTGDTGTGKELVSRAIHRLSGRSGAFVAMNCGAFPAALVEAELFGFRKGSFSGATEDRAGLVRSAQSGTLFLDEVGDIPLSAQTAFLRVLQEREVTPIGGVAPVPVDFRLISATHRSLEKRVQDGSLREDFVARLSGFAIHLPPLRDRLEDIGILISRILASASEPKNSRLTLEAARALFTHDWPRNVRELEHRAKLAAVLAKGEPIELEHLFAVDGDPSPELDRSELHVPLLGPEDVARRDELKALLREHNGNVTAVARAMGKARVQVQRWIRRYELKRRDPS